MTQGDPLDIIPYTIGILPLIYEIRYAHPQVTQPWYYDGAGMVRTFSALRNHLEDLMMHAPIRGYFTKPTKSILVVLEKNFPRAEAYFQGMGLRAAKGNRYPGVFIGNHKE